MKNLLVHKKNMYFYPWTGNQSNRCCQLLSNNPILFKTANLLRLMNATVPHFFYSDWKNQIENSSLIILTDLAYISGLKKYIEKINNNCKVVYYFLNPIINIPRGEEHLKVIKSEYGDQIYTFDYSDSKKYDIKYKHFFYQPIKGYLSQSQDCDEVFDLVYLGRDKERGGVLEKLYEQWNDSLNIKFSVLGFKGMIGIDQPIEYKEYISYVQRSKAIVDVVNNGHIATNLRPMEALFYGKKLITNDGNIVLSEIYQYIKDRTLIVDFEHISIDEVKEFLNREVNAISLDMLRDSNYSFDNWMNSFDE